MGNTDDYFEVGVITGPFGVWGDVKVFPTTDEPERFNDLEQVYIDSNPVKILNVRFQKNMVILNLEGASDRETAAKLKGKTLKISPEFALPLEDNQYYHRDLIGLSVLEENGRELGTLTRILQTGANDVYAINNGSREMLIPAVSQFILSVDLPSKTMTVKLLPGLEDL